MKTLSMCYNQDATRVSDSFRSRPSNRRSKKNSRTPSVQNSVSSVYKSALKDSMKEVLITLTWIDSLVRQGFNLEIFDGTNPDLDGGFEFRRREGYSEFGFNDMSVEVCWNFIDAEFKNGVEPGGRFFLMVALDSELCLKLGDAYGCNLEVERMAENLKVAKTRLISSCERFSGNTSYATKARFLNNGPQHEVVIKCVKEIDSPMLLVVVDGRRMVRVENLQWNFRGSQSIFVDGLVVDLMWDVHDWFFSPNSWVGTDAVFLFRTRSNGGDSRLWYEDKNLGLDACDFSLVLCGSKTNGDAEE